jgi:AcrR family transcriptional regulator
MGKIRRISGEQRRESILKAARVVFAEHGFRGTTTRALAEAADVSEALLFQHFPTKDAIYAAVQASFFQDLDSELQRRLLALEPSTEALVKLVFGFYGDLINPSHAAARAEVAVLARLMFRSLVEDGEFARSFIRRVPAPLIAKLDQCIQAAAAKGDITNPPSHASTSAWFIHHLAVTIMLYQLPDPPAVSYGIARRALITEAARFALRGIGLSEKALRRYSPSDAPGARRR